ncbi:MAG: LEA type 2 family protein [Bacteroidales bacterium]|nr:LEA type 2 family protein [Bacteroidales bacterium]MBN2763239.1 LEA type 2 family protein [Bacteroidales bacterium]
MSSIFKSFIIVLPFVLMLSSCKNIDDIELKGVDTFIFQGFENNIVYFSAGLNVNNPSGVNFKIREVNLKTVANGDFLGTLNCTDNVRIEARTDSVYRVPMSLKLANIFSGASTLYKISRQSKVNLEVKGYIRVRTFMISRKIEVSESQVLDVPRIR